MTKPHGHAHSRSSLGTRLPLAFQALVALALLAIALAPLAAPVVSPEPASAEADFIGEEGGEESEEGEWELEEMEEEGEEEEEFGSKGAAVLPPECLLRSVEPAVVAERNSGTLRLALQYTARTPTRVDIDYWLKGGKGSLQLGSATRHLGHQGTLHLTSRLDEHEAAKARAARAFIVDLDLPAAPSGCEKYLTLRLSAKDLDRSRATWSERGDS